MLPNLLVNENSQQDEGPSAEQKDFQDGIDFDKALHEALHFSFEFWGAKRSLPDGRQTLSRFEFAEVFHGTSTKSRLTGN